MTHTTTIESIEESNGPSKLLNTAGRVSAGEMNDVIGQIRDAFQVFDSQSLLLKRAYDRLREDLADTNRKLSEKNKALSRKVWELEEMSGRLQCVIESLTDSVLVVDTDLKVERCNRAAESLLGVGRSEILGRGYGEITNGLGDIQKLIEVLESGRAVLDDERKSRLMDADVYVVASIAPIYSPDGDILGAVEVLRNITAEKELEARVELHKRMSALGQMAASVAHEIRNPLGTIEGFARLLKRDLADMPDHLRLASRIVEGAQNLNYVITNLLEYTRPAFIENAPVDCRSLLRDTEDLLRDKALKKGVVLAVESESVRLSGDARQLRQVLVNLGLNAIEACQSGGRVVIKAYPKGSACVFSVQDSGCGIGDKDLGQVFDPFFTKKAGGTGLGLALCHKIVAAHSGEITVSSKPDEGSRFEVVINVSGEKK